MRRPTPATDRSAHRRGFTLIELMIVVVILGILMALVLPAVLSALEGARRAEVVAEIRGLEAAIANFKNTYGIEPPSRIRLYETSGASPSWSTHSGSFTQNGTGQMVLHDAERTRSIALINRIWPNFDYTIARDLNGDTSFGGFVDLTGDECLVFFLGGVATGSPGAFAVTGFSKNPANPLAVASGTESRDGPFFEFKPSRLKFSLNPTNSKVLVYFDPRSSQTLPYVYASSNDGRGYQPADLYVGSSDDLEDVYRTGPGGAMAVAQKAKSFQIITPGTDGAYGSGGAFVTTAVNHGLASKADYDNLTNFHNGRLID